MTSTASRPIIDADLVLLDVDAGADKQAVIGRLVGRLADAGRTTDPDGLTAAAMAREEQSATGLPGGIAIPHCRSPHVDTASIGFARLQPPVDFGAPDGPADLAFLIAAPEAGGAEHMKLLSSLARALVRKEFVQSLREASTPDEVVSLVDEVLNPGEKPKPAAAEKPAAEKPRTLVAITACPTGIAHTYMAADSLVAAAKEAGVTLHVETQGSSGSTPLSADTIAGADAVIFATDVGVKDKGRFAGKPVVASGVKRAINEPAKMVAEALAAATNPNAARVEGSGAGAPASAAPAGGVGWGTRTRQILLTGVSYMIPFVAAGGLLIALGFLFGGYEIANSPDGEKPSLPYGFGSIGHVIASTNSLTNLPSGGLIAVSRRGPVHTRRPGIHVPGPRTRRLHLVRDRGSARYRTRIHRRRGRRLRRRWLHRRYRRRSHRRLHGAVDQPYRHTAVAQRLDARRDHPACSHR